MRFIKILIAAALCTTAGCDIGNQQLPVTVAVYPSAQNCTVKIDEVEAPVPCGETGKYLQDRQIAVGRQIDVAMFRMEKTHNEKEIDAVAERIRSWGFTDVRVWRFGLE